MRVTVFEKDGVKYPIDVSESTGKFSCVIDTEKIEAETLEKLKEKINRTQRRKTVKLALPATVAKKSHWDSADPDSFVDVVITGIHQRNRTVLFRRVSDKKADSIGYHDTLFKRLKPEEHAEYQKLRTAKLAATTAVEKFEKKHTYDIEQVKKEVRAAEQAAGIEPSEDD